MDRDSPSLDDLYGAGAEEAETRAIYESGLANPCRVVMIGPRGERDYVEKLLDNGCPVICGDDMEFAALLDKEDAESMAEGLRGDWLSPHVAVEVERASRKVD